MRRNRGSLSAAVLSILFLALTFYSIGYYATVERALTGCFNSLKQFSLAAGTSGRQVPQPRYRDRRPTYRIGSRITDDWAVSFFNPIHQFDRVVRHSYWRQRI